MTHNAESNRRFRVYARDMGSHQSRVIEESSFEAAAIAFVEAFDFMAPLEDDAELRVIVHEVGTGHEHCFKLNLDTGETTPCG
jgi:hypothetical protein